MSDTQNTQQKTAESAVAEMVARAKRAQDLRKTAPPITASGDVTVQQKVLINKYAASSGGQDNKDGYHFWFGNRKLLQHNIDQGNEPVIDPITGEHVHYEGDPMLKCPTWMHRQNLNVAVAKSAMMLKKVTREQVESPTAPADSEVGVRYVQGTAGRRGRPPKQVTNEG
jgi:hypothetical protein